MLRVISFIAVLLLAACQNASALVRGGYTTAASSAILPNWTVYSSPGNIIYVSDSTGSDGNTCTAAPPVNNSFATPCKTLAHALSLVSSGNGDWVVLKAGDTWVNQSFGTLTKSGASCSAPLLFTSYGSGARPIIEPISSVNTGFGIDIPFGGSVDFVAVQGLNFYAYQRDPGNGSFSISEMKANYTGISVRKAVNCFDFEDNVVSFFATNAELQGDPATPIPGETQTWIGNQILNAYFPGGNQVSGGHSQGMHAEFIAGSLNQSFNVSDTNGWNPTLAGPFTASMTCASPSVFTVTGLRVANGAAITLSGTPCTGFSVNTPFCVINVSGTTTLTFNVTANTGLNCPNGTTTLNGTGTSSGLSVTYIDVQPVIFNRNYYLSNQTPNNFQYNISSNSSAEGAEFRAGGTVQHNIFWGNSEGFDIGGRDAGTPTVTSWTGGGNVIQFSGDIKSSGLGNQARAGGITTINVNGITITNELISHVDAGALTGNQTGITLDTDVSGSTNNTTATNSVICLWRLQAFDQSGGTGNTITPNQGTTSSCTSSGFLDGTRTVATYDSVVLGGPGTYAHLLGLMQTNSKASWNPAYGVPAIETWIRAGYNLAP